MFATAAQGMDDETRKDDDKRTCARNRNLGWIEATLLSVSRPVRIDHDRVPEALLIPRVDCSRRSRQKAGQDCLHSLHGKCDLADDRRKGTGGSFHRARTITVPPDASASDAAQTVDDAILILLRHLVKERKNESGLGDVIGDGQSGFPARRAIGSLAVNGHDGSPS